MNYLTEAKNFLSGTFTSAKNGVEHYYPVIRDEAKELFVASKDFAGRSVIWIKEKALENPTLVVASSNFTLGLLALRMHKLSKKIVGLVLREDNQKLNNRAAWVLVGAAVVGANYLAFGVVAGFAAKTIVIAAASGLALGLTTLKIYNVQQAKEAIKLRELRKEVSGSLLEATKSVQLFGKFMLNLTPQELRKLNEQLSRK